MPLSSKTQFRNRTNTGLLALAFVVIAITSVVSVRSINALRDSIDWITHTLAVRDELSALQRELGLMEADGLRYMVGGLKMHRDGLETHLGNVGEGVLRLKSLASDNDHHQKALSWLQADYERLRARARRSVEIKQEDMRRGDDRAAIRRLRDGRGEDIVDRMRRTIDEMAEEEGRLLAERQANRDSLVKQTNATLLIANGLALFAGLLGFVALRRAQREAENALIVELRAAQARRASDEKSAFLANMSHEIRTPMNAIFGFAQLLADHVNEPLQKEWVASIRKSGQMLLALINDVLDLSKIEAGKLQLNPQGTDVAELVLESAGLFEPMAEAKGLLLRCEIENAELVPVAVDAQRLRQILMNLLSNAVKYTEAGEVVVRVTMLPSPLGDGRDLRISVQDSGTGIDPDEQARIFEPFYQADSLDGKPRQGTGLGLSITKRLVDLMHGRIHVASRPGQGATFRIDIPDLLPAVPTPALSAVEAGERADFDVLPTLKVLVVDDVEWNIEVAKGYFQGSRHEIAVARDGLEAVAMTRMFRPDVVLMDLRMPSMNGDRAVEAIRADPVLRDTRVIAVTASSLIDEDGMRPLRFDGYIRKPYAPIELFGALRALFGTREGEDATSAAPAATTIVDSASMADRRDRALAEWRTVRAAPLQALRQRMRVREIGEFSKLFDALAADIGDAELGAEAQRLHLAVQRFDVHQMKTVLDRLAAWPDDDDQHASQQEAKGEGDAH
ncbi:ATP-binding protein [Lysobacter hankyongensis]|uniref:histidine kinase n=1 Tax=Lysobacter hankyongensis TaxID=1176535 RepID=A0ABP9B177_9GAMM